MLRTSKFKDIKKLYPVVSNSFYKYIHDVNNIERDLKVKEIDELNELITTKNKYFERIYFLSDTNEHNLYKHT